MNKREIPDSRLTDTKPKPPKIGKLEGTKKTAKDFIPEPKPESMLKKLLQPKTIAGKVIGAIGSILGIGGGGFALDIDGTYVIIVALAVGAGYLLGWSKQQVKEFIEFLKPDKEK